MRQLYQPVYTPEFRSSMTGFLDLHYNSTFPFTGVTSPANLSSDPPLSDSTGDPLLTLSQAKIFPPFTDFASSATDI